MPPLQKPLFRPDVVRKHIKATALPDVPEKLREWAKLLAGDKVNRRKETELLPNFLTDVFETVLGYDPPPMQSYTIRRESLVVVGGKRADAALGRFGGTPETYAVMIEGKGPKDPLDIPFAGRPLSAVQQASEYAIQQKTNWYAVTNLREIRLYSKLESTRSYERFETARLAEDREELKRFKFLLGADRVLGGTGNHLDALLAESAKVGKEVTNEYYREYHGLRVHTFNRLRHHNPEKSVADLLAATQKMLDRILFAAFCEDRGLLPPNIIDRAYKQRDEFNPRAVWDNFLGLFRHIDKGKKELDIPPYNGGLFKKDEFFDSLTVPDSVCEGFRKLSEYEYGTGDGGKNVDVEILGHIFEQSIQDLEELQKAAAAAVPELAEPGAGPTRRKRDGAFYTPNFATRYIVQETLGPVLADKFEAYRKARAGRDDKYAGLFKKNPRELTADGLSDGEKAAVASFWEGWVGELTTVRVLDPSCGSGAFLIEAFDQLHAAYDEAAARSRYFGGRFDFDTDREILLNNLFGVDLNHEAVQIARLSCWIKTCVKNKPLTNLNDNIKEGNSLKGDGGVFGPKGWWKEHFPDAMSAGGFDCVVGNPPYVRQEWITADKPFLKKHYKAFDGVADLYVYFYELGLNLLKPGGRLGYIVTNKWMKAGYGEALRKLYAEEADVEQVIDFGHAKQIFPDADVFPSILVMRKPLARPTKPKKKADELARGVARVCVIPREQLRIEDLSRQIKDEGVEVPRSRFGGAPWSLEPPGVNDLIAKLRAAGVPLKDWIKSSPFRGILTGFNEAFLIDTATKDKLVAADPKSEPLFRQYMRGQDLDRWQAGWSGLWMIAMKSSGNYAWSWASKPTDKAEAIFSRTYPALFKHFSQYRSELVKRQDQGENWWELRACAYWNSFDSPKIMYQVIQYHPCYCIDTSGRLGNDKTFSLSANDLYLLGLLNSALMWWHNWRTLVHLKDEALSPMAYLIEQLPIVEPSTTARTGIESSVRQLVDLSLEGQASHRDLINWLRMEFDVVKPSQKLQNPASLSAEEFYREVKKARGKDKPLSVAAGKHLTEQFNAVVLPLKSTAREIAALELLVSERVNEAYGLTPGDVKLMWQTAPPRMPTPPPAA